MIRVKIFKEFFNFVLDNSTHEMQSSFLLKQKSFDKIMN